MWRIYDCIVNEHNHALVVLAALICVAGSITTFAVLERAQKALSRVHIWYVLLAFTAGTTIWSTHFVAMLAYQQNLPIAFEPIDTFASLLAGIVIVGAGLITVAAKKHSVAAIVLGGFAIGIGTSTLHYVGVHGLILPGKISFDAGFVGVSVLASVGFGTLSLSHIRGRMDFATRTKSIVLFVLMIVSLHFTGMAGTTVELGYWDGNAIQGLSRSILTILVAVSSISILAIAAMVAFFDSKRSSIAKREAQRFRVLADSALEGIVVLSRSTIEDFNTSAARLLKLTADHRGCSMHDFMDAAALSDLVRAASGAAVSMDEPPIEISLRDADGTIIVTEVSCRSIELADGKDGYVLAIRDMRETRAAQEKAQFVALHDPLTGLPNREMFKLFSGKAVAEANKHKTQFAVMVIDLDNFKTINDLYGHDAGDEYLKEISGILANELRKTDIIARLGSDEFAILETSMDQPSSAQKVARRLLEAARKKGSQIGDIESVSLSIGVSIYPDDGVSIEGLLQNAETAMTRAKRGGRNNYLFFEKDMEAAMSERRSLEKRLRHAADNDGFTINYQPIVDSVTREPRSFEALVRWEDAELGFVPPDKFIPVAEETGIIVDIGKQVLRKACTEAAKWPDHVRVAVNLSVVQFEQPGLLETVKQTLQETGMPPTRLDLEITESIVLSDSVHTLEVLNAFKAMGIRISMDDFGTGYSSLSYLQSFPFDKLKIDRVFVSELEAENNNAAIVKAVVAMGQSLDMCVVAEGVENDSQLMRLASLGCSEIQGYLIAKPMPADQVSVFLGQTFAA